MNKKCVVLITSLLLVSAILGSTSLWHAKTLKTPLKSILAQKAPIRGIDSQLIALSICESNRHARAKFLDWDGFYSYGILQFHKATLAKYAIRYGFRTEITEEDLYNPSLAMETAKAMIKESPRNWYAWYNCAKIVKIIK